jgi:hypothetical protein
MQYKTTLIERERIFIIGDDIDFNFVIKDSNGLLVNDISSWEFKVYLNSANMNEVEMSGSTYLTTSGGKVVLSIPTSITTNLEDDISYRLNLVGILSTKIYTLCEIEIWFKNRNNNW